RVEGERHESGSIRQGYSARSATRSVANALSADTLFAQRRSSAVDERREPGSPAPLGYDEHEVDVEVVRLPPFRHRPRDQERHHGRIRLEMQGQPVDRLGGGLAHAHPTTEAREYHRGH